MAIVIDDKHTVDLIRKIGRRTGEGPLDVVRRLAESEASLQPDRDPKDVEAAYLRLMEINRLHGYKGPPISPEESRRIQDELFDYLDEEAVAPGERG